MCRYILFRSNHYRPKQIITITSPQQQRILEFFSFKVWMSIKQLVFTLRQILSISNCQILSFHGELIKVVFIWNKFQNDLIFFFHNHAMIIPRK